MSTGQQVRSGGESMARVSTQRGDGCPSGEEGDQRAGVEQDAASVTPEAFHVLGVGAQVGGGVLVDAEDAHAAGDVAAVRVGLAA